ncbi:MAG: hypothetical protein K4571_03115 [Deltaproteobacteria bacterium]
MKAIFFESNATLMAKNLLPIANVLNSKEKNFTATFISAEIASNVDAEMERKAISAMTSRKNFKFVILKSFNHQKIKNFLEQEKPDIFFIDCYRIIDQLWVGAANSLGIQTCLLQHGFEPDSAYYKLFSIVTKFGKGLRLANASYHLSRLLNVSFVTLFYQYFKYIYTGTPLKNTFLGAEALHPAKVFLYSEYYKEFWNNKYGFSAEKAEVISYPDFMLIERVKKMKRETALCYITQTLVEDGRMKKKEFLKLMEAYKKIAEKVDKFVIKLHPRGNPALYKMFDGMPNVLITREFPNCSAYLTHYSSMAFVAAFLSDAVIFHELEGHPTPGIYEAIPIATVKNAMDILDVYNGSKTKAEPDIDVQRKKLDYYASFDGIDIYETIYKSLKRQRGASPIQP